MHFQTHPQGPPSVAAATGMPIISAQAPIKMLQPMVLQSVHKDLSGQGGTEGLHVVNEKGEPGVTKIHGR
jgi:hypothetical protein